MKKKLWLMGFCICILIIIFVRNVYVQINQDKDTASLDGQENTQIASNKLSIGEAYRLSGYLGLNDEELKELLGISAVNADSDKDTAEKDTAEEALKLDGYLNFGQSIKLLEKTCEVYSIDKDEVIKKLSFDLEGSQEKTAMLTEDFLNLYESILEVIPADKKPVTEKTLFCLGTPDDTKDDGKDYSIVTDDGTYSYEGAVSYEGFYTNGVLNGAKDTEGKSITDFGKSFSPGDYEFCAVKVMVSGEHFVYIKGTLSEETTLHNVWITSGEDSMVTAFINGITKSFHTKYKLSQEIQSEIGDLVLQNKEIIKISIKPDTIGGKVLVANDKYIELEGYGELELDQYYKIYKIYDELSMEVTNSILVGYDATDFVVANGKVVAALIKEKIKAKNIRVIIKTNNYEAIYHDSIQFTATKDFTVTIGNETKSYKAGKKITLKQGDTNFEEGRISIKTKSESGKIKLLSLKRASGTPAYRGTIEISSTEEGLIVINELSIEEYLYAVIPSEMPTSYGLEALKVQAICARSYAYNQVLQNDYSEFGAHVDDSSSYQVYNNSAENEDSILAVKDTYGKVIKYDDSVITAYYFSTSCGHTASVNEVWSNSGNINYLVGKLQTVSDNKDGDAVAASGNNNGEADFSSESAFRSFILDTSDKTYDSSFAWYRWKVTESLKDITNAVNKSLASRYNANPALIQTLVGGKIDKNPKYESYPISTVGTVKAVKIGVREESGIVSELIIVGSENTIKVQSEYNIRTLLAPLTNDVIRQDESKVSNLSMLPSAFFVMDASGDSITFQGGGYGHGVGMSQNGVKAMADTGLDYETIIKHYYDGVELGSIY